MRKLKVLIEGNSPDSVRLVEVVTTVPVATLIAALIEAMQMPKTDLFGKQLAYQLRWGKDGQVIPMDVTLAEAGVTLGARLILDSFENDDEAFSSASNRQQLVPDVNANVDVYTAVTLVDPAQFSATPHIQEAQYPPYLESKNALGVYDTAGNRRPSPLDKKRQGPSRRTFLFATGAILGVGGIGLAYATHRMTIDDEIKRLLTKNPPMTPVVAGHPKAVSNVQPTARTAPPPTARLQFTFMKHLDIVRGVAWSPDGKLLASCADDKHVFLWKADGTTQLDILHDAGVRALAWSPDSQRIVTGANVEVSFFTVQNGVRLAHSTHRHTQMITSLAWTAQNEMRVVSGGADKQAFVWDTKTYASLTRYQQHNASIDVVAWSSNGQTIASSADDGMVRIWNATDGKDIHGYYLDAKRPMRAMAFAPMGAKLAVGGDDGMVRVWNALTCKNDGQRCTDEPQRLPVSQKSIRALAWSPDGRWLAVGANDGVFSLWNTEQGQQALFSMKQNDIVRSIAWSPDGKQLATAFGKSVSIWNIV